MVDHARVEGANDPEAIAAEAEAVRVAARAVQALRQSRAQVCTGERRYVNRGQSSSGCTSYSIMHKGI